MTIDKPPRKNIEVIAAPLRKNLCVIASLLMAGFLSGCIGLPKLHLPASGAPVAAAAPSKPICPGSLLADLETEPQLPAGAGFPGAQTEAESAAVSLYLTWLHSYAVWARHGQSRVSDAREFCSTQR